VCASMLTFLETWGDVVGQDGGGAKPDGSGLLNWCSRGANGQNTMIMTKLCFIVVQGARTGVCKCRWKNTYTGLFISGGYYRPYHISEMSGDRSYVGQLIAFIREGAEPLTPSMEERIRLFAIRKKDEAKEMAGNGQLSFGKYAGKTIAELAGFDMGYVKWLAKNDKYVPADIRLDIEKAIALH